MLARQKVGSVTQGLLRVVEIKQAPRPLLFNITLILITHISHGVKVTHNQAFVVNGMPESPLAKIWSSTMETIVAAVVGVDEVVVGIDEAVVGVDETVVGVDETVVGIDETVVGIDEAVVGIDEAVVGIDEMVVGIDETVVGEGVGMDVSDSDK